MNSGTSSGVTSNCPLGFFSSLAIFAINLLGPMPAEDVSFVLRKIMSRMTCASAPGAPGCAVTSRYASSSESGSTNVVKR